MVNRVHNKTDKTQMEALPVLKTLKSIYHAERIHNMLTPCCWKHSLTPVL